VTVRGLQGSYMLGEETVLIKALEGKRAAPDQRPPYPTERGLFDRPTVVNNVATLAAVPWILVKGAQAFAAIGAKDARARRSCSCAGRAARASPRSRSARPQRHHRPHRRQRQSAHQGDPRRRPDRRLPADGRAEHPVHVRRPARGRRPHRLGLHRHRRRAGLHRRPRPPPDPLLRRPGVRQVDPLSDRSAAPVEIGDRAAAGTRAPGTPSSSPTCARRLRQRPVRPRAHRHLRPRHRAPLLPIRARRPLLRSTCPAGVCTPIAVAGGAASRGAAHDRPRIRPADEAPIRNRESGRTSRPSWTPSRPATIRSRRS